LILSHNFIEINKTGSSNDCTDKQILSKHGIISKLPLCENITTILFRTLKRSTCYL